MEKLVRSLKRLRRSVRGELPHLWVTHLSGRREFFGSTYGGWTVLTAELDVKSVVYSFGIGLDYSFDVALIERFGCDVHAFDPTPGLGAILETHELPTQFKFYPMGLAAENAVVEMCPLDASGESSSTIISGDFAANNQKPQPVEASTLKNVMTQLGHEHIDLLKIDIEGAEVDAVPQFLADGVRPRQVLVEIHPGFSAGVLGARQCLYALRDHGYQLFDVSTRHVEFGFVLK